MEEQEVEIRRLEGMVRGLRARLGVLGGLAREKDGEGGDGGERGNVDVDMEDEDEGDGVSREKARGEETTTETAQWT